MYIVTTKDSKTTLENQVLHLHINQDRRPRPPSLYPPQDLEELTAPGSGKVMRQAVSSCYADDGTARRYWQGLDPEPKDLIMKPAPLKVLFWPHLQLFCLVIMKSSRLQKAVLWKTLYNDCWLFILFHALYLPVGDGDVHRNIFKSQFIHRVQRKLVRASLDLGGESLNL